MSFGEVCDLRSESLVVGTVIEVGSWKTLSMSLQGVNLLDLAPIRQSYVFDSKDICGIVTIGGDLSCDSTQRSRLGLGEAQRTPVS